YIAESRDGGVTWTDPREALAGQTPTTAGMLQLADGRVVLQFLRDAQPGKSDHSSWYSGCGMRAVISDDEGKTWQDPLYVVSRIYADGQEPTGFGAYLGDTVELADGRLLTTGTIGVSSQNRFSAITWKP
ncbi:MAG: sialidase family protein, partial [Pirellulaceae bacterium]|nr:sialidase family protein [Pirellulaceae bacterium]